ncbi:glycosyltransferase family 2 protein [Ciceribacter sp. L1K23]|uniref:glycosyltransferase family 2 protein n=1 Tax=Ciceribacter sp. L1K23 TaxID=2820276 RepID=UPI001B8299DD|nr:glycosyltransferase family 2 protein [Ciceribacter sp. L1K23]MBR0557930.1 glycosyltransferase family 2 protein [Ciceribacter sp. L1K23]
MKATLVLCTKNGGDRLRECLRNINLLDVVDLQVVIVDNGSDDGVSYELSKEFERETRFDCVVLQTFEPGNSAGRNRAVELIEGDFCVFIDDDCYASPSLINEWASVFSSHDIGYGSGKIRRHNPQHSWLGCYEGTEIRWVNAGDVVPRGLIQGSNMAFLTKAIRSVGLFDVRFGAGTPLAGEEWELALRVSFAGWAGGYFPGPEVSHDHRRVDAEAASRGRYYDYGGGAVYAKHARSPNRLKVIKRFISDVFAYRSPASTLMLLRGFLEFYPKYEYQK